MASEDTSIITIHLREKARREHDRLPQPGKRDVAPTLDSSLTRKTSRDQTSTLGWTSTPGQRSL